MAGDLTYRIDIDSASAQASLSKLQTSFDKLGKTAGSLKASLAGLFLGSTLSSALKYADGIDDISKATGIAVANIVGLSAAFVSNGGSAESAREAILKFTQNIGDAANGSLTAQNAFQRVGISLDELRKLSEQDLLRKALDNIAKMPDAAKRSSAAIDILGKGIKGVDIQGLNSDYDAAIVRARQYSAAISEGAKTQDMLSATITQFQLALLKSFKPMAEFLNALKPEQIQSFVDAVVKIGGALGAVIAVAKAFDYLAIAIAAFTGSKIVTYITGLVIQFRVLTAYGAAWGATLLTLGRGAVAALIPILAGFAEIAAIIAAVIAVSLTLLKTWDLVFGTNYFGNFIDGVKNAYDWLLKLTGLRDKSTAGGGRGNGQAELDQRAADAKEADRIREVTDALAKRRAEIQKSSIQFALQNNLMIDSINFENTLIGKTEDEIAVLRIRENIFLKAAEDSQKLRDAKSLLSKEERGLAGVYDQQISKIGKIAEVDAERVAKALRGNQDLKMKEAARLQDQQNIIKAIEDQISRRQTLDELLKGASTAVIGPRDQDIGVLNALQQKLYDLGQANRSAAEAAGKSWADSFAGMDMTTEQSAELATGLDEIAAAYGRLYAAQVEFTMANYHNSQSFELGWRKAFSSFKDSALDTASIVKNSFDNFTRGLEDAIVNFVRTGKLSFNDLANSAAADLTRIAVRKGISAAIGFLGFANGGEPPVGVPSIVGERGPELFVPKTAGTIIPNHKLGGGGGSPLGESMPTTVNYSIQAVDASSFRSLVARDPGFIYSVTEAGRRSQPSRRGV